jgi:hypothetical protein
MLIMTNLLFHKTKIMLQKTIKYKLAKINLAVCSSLWYLYYEECFDLRSKSNFKGKTNMYRAKAVSYCSSNQGPVRRKV